jgi:hypothetical protein
MRMRNVVLAHFNCIIKEKYTKLVFSPVLGLHKTALPTFLKKTAVPAIF